MSSDNVVPHSPDASIAPVRSRYLSLWQSAVETAITQHQRFDNLTNNMAASPGADRALTAADLAASEIERPDVRDPFMRATSALAERRAAQFALHQTLISPLLTGISADAARAEDRLPSDVGSLVKDCAELAFELAIAIATGSPRVEALRSEFEFNVCDPLWATAIATYVAFLAGGGSPVYRGWTDPDPVFPFELRPDARIAFVADWGTGLPPAVQLIEQIRDKFSPDVVIHLGDIYYAGTTAENERYFYDKMASVFDLQETLVLSLCGNHDMYAGGAPYYALLDRLGQKTRQGVSSSVFCLRNKHWQFLAMNTGFHDNDPLPIPQQPLTSLQPEEVLWMQARLNEAGDRKSVLLSHHQPISAFDTLDGTGHNPRLTDPFANFQDRIALWLWGHEHNMVIFDEDATVRRGRCIGCGAIPVFKDLDPYKQVTAVKQGAPRLSLLDGVDPPMFAHGYAVMTLDGPEATVQYIDAQRGPGAPLFEERL